MVKTINGFNLIIDDPIGRLRLDRPLRKNTLTQEMWEALPGILDRLAKSEACKVLIFEATRPGPFSAGADITEFRAIAKDEKRRIGHADAIWSAIHALKTFPKPVIAKIEGDCVGGGCSLILACDLRYCVEGVSFGITPARLGLVYSAQDTKALIDLIGPAHAKELLFTARLIDAQHAAQIGLVNRALDPAELSTHVEQVARQIASVSQHSVRGMKSIIALIENGASSDTPATRALFQDSYLGPDHEEGVAAFLEKRVAHFPVK